MAYCTQDDLEALIPVLELARLTTESGDEPDAVVVVGAIAAADAEIDSYLLVRYQLPLAVTPARVKALSMDLAIYKLFQRRSVSNEARRTAYEDAVKFLQLVAKGLAVIEGADNVEPPGQTQDVTEIISGGGLGERVFTRGKMQDW